MVFETNIVFVPTSQEGDFRPSHTFDFMDFYPDGVGSVVYHHHHSLLVIGGSGVSGEVEDTDSSAPSHGIGAWRILSGLPYYKRVTDYNTERAEVGRVYIYFILHIIL